MFLLINSQEIKTKNGVKMAEEDKDEDYEGLDEGDEWDEEEWGEEEEEEPEEEDDEE